MSNNNIRLVFRHLLEMMVSGELAVGDRLPTEKELANEFGTTRMNVFRALHILKEYRLIESKKRAGTVVIAKPAADLYQKLLNDSSRVVYVLESTMPKYVQWNQSTLTALEVDLNAHNYQVIYLPLIQDRAHFARIIDQSMHDGAAALVIFPDSVDIDFLNDNNDLLVNVSTPVLMLNRGNDISRIDFVSSVTIDIYGDAIHMASLLKKNGFTRPLVLASESDECLWQTVRLRGLDLGFRAGSPVLELEKFSLSPDSISRMLEAAAADPGHAVIIAAHPRGARIVIQLAAAQGLTAGKDYQLVSFDDDKQYAAESLTTTQVRFREVGHLFARMIYEKKWQIQGTVWSSVRIASRLVQRTSCRPLHNPES